MVCQIKRLSTKGVLICSIAAMFYAYEFILRVLPSSIADSLMHAYGIGAQSLGFLLSLYYWAYNPMQLPVGLLYDRYGPRRLLLAAIGSCTLAALLMGYVSSPWLAGVALFFMGFGSSFAFVGAMKLSVIWLPARFLSLAASIATTLAMIGAVTTDHLIPLVRSIPWQHVWYNMAGLGGILFCLVLFWVREKQPVGHHIAKMSRHSWKNLFSEIKTCMSKKLFWLHGMIGSLLFLPLGIFGPTWGILYFTQGCGFSEAAAGHAIAALFWGAAVGGPLIAWLSSRWLNRKQCLLTGCVIGCLLFLYLAFAPHLQPLTAVLVMFAFGVVASAENLVFAANFELVADEFAGTAIAATNFSVQVLIILFQPLFGYIIEHSSGNIDAAHFVYAASSYHQAVLIFPVTLAIASLLALQLPKQERPTSSSQSGQALKRPMKSLSSMS